jgi:hypothetical protein
MVRVRTRFKVALFLLTEELAMFARPSIREHPHTFDRVLAQQLLDIGYNMDPEDVDESGAVVDGITVHRPFGALDIQIESPVGTVEAQAVVHGKATFVPGALGAGLVFTAEALLTGEKLGELAISMGTVEFSGLPKEEPRQTSIYDIPGVTAPLPGVELGLVLDPDHA